MGRVGSCPSGSPPNKFLQGVTEISGGGNVSLAIFAGKGAVRGNIYRGSLGAGTNAPAGTAYSIQVNGLNMLSLVSK